MGGGGGGDGRHFGGGGRGRGDPGPGFGSGGGLLRELVPAAVRVAVLVNPDDTQITPLILRDVEAAAHAMGLQIQVVRASTGRELAGE